ncbi:MAG TPA: YihY/virulence factor BrkB family protein [Gemmatimonadaceae bacterium]|nr:YihY/virulence factor BrkB family protein [Gemmatimonadaceae bacterium]
MSFSIRHTPGLLWRALKKFFGDNCTTMAAALSFSTVFSLPALLALMLMLLGSITDTAAVTDAIIRQVQSMVGPAAADQMRTIVGSIHDTKLPASVTAMLGGLALLFGATAAFAQLQGALNRAWNVKPDPRRGDVRNFLTKRIFSFGVVLVVAFLLLVSLALSAFVNAIGTRVAGMVGLPDGLLIIANAVLSFVIIAALFGAMFKYLPDARIGWRDVGVGAVSTALLFVLGKELIGLYLGSSDPGNAYGAAGSLVIVLLWIYYTSMIVLFGAELTRAWADEYGSGVKPERGAVEFVEQEKPVQAG